MMINKATTISELDEVFNFRYEIYVNCMGKNYNYYDINKKQINEDLDSNAHIYIMLDQANNILGTARVNYGSEYSLIKEIENLNIDIATIEQKSYCLVSKLITHPAIWKTGKPLVLIKQIFKDLLMDKIDLTFIYCFDKLLPFFERLGFIKIGESTSYKEYQKVNILLLNMNDKEWFKQINSPFYKIHTLQSTNH